MADCIESERDMRLARKYELWDELPDGYGEAAARVASFQTLAEIVGVLLFSEWIDQVPDYARKQMLVAKVQDEVGHGQVTARVAEDLGARREQIMLDFVEGRTKVLNVFHYGFDSWEEIGPGALMQNSAAIIQFQSLHQGTYLPYARALRKIEKEESFHYHHALDMTHQTMTYGNAEQRNRVQDAFDIWLPRILAYFGPPDTDTYRDNPLYGFGLKVDSNDALRQEWLRKMVPVFQKLGVYVDPGLTHYDEDGDRWWFASPDWDAIKKMLREGGPRHEDWRTKIADSLERNALYRDVSLMRNAA